MNVHRFLIILFACCVRFVTIAAVRAEEGLRDEQAAVSVSREVTFELTFANRDLIWLGDPAAPTAWAYPKPGAVPFASDCYVTTVVENHASPQRRYFRDARIIADKNVRQVRAFTRQREQLIGTIDDQGRFSPNAFYQDHRELLPAWPDDVSQLAYDRSENALFSEISLPGPAVSESTDFLPLQLVDSQDRPVVGVFALNWQPSDKQDETAQAVVSLTWQHQEQSLSLAQAKVPRMFRSADIRLCSFDNQAGTYLPESKYRPGAIGESGEVPRVTVKFSGEFTSHVRSDKDALMVVAPLSPSDQTEAAPANVAIDGKFDDWRNVNGVDDPRGDLVPYLDYVPDVDLLEFKIAHDSQHVYFYARVAGQVGRTHADGGRSYFYAYMDVDRNPGTGFLPTRDDECYFGVAIGDDCEVQFEFVDNRLRKTFYGFCGKGGDDNVLRQTVAIGKSQYGRFDANGVERADYKSEYTYHQGVTAITEDLKMGSSDTIQVAISPDGSEVEIASHFNGFLKDAAGRPIVGLGQMIDVAAGMECDSKAYPGKSQWAADNTIPLRGYRLKP